MGRNESSQWTYSRICNCSMFCCTLLFVHSSIAIIFMGKRELIALLYLSSWCLVMVEWRFLAVPWGCLRFVIVVFPDHTHLLFLQQAKLTILYTAGGLFILIVHQYFSIKFLNLCLKITKQIYSTYSNIYYIYESTCYPLHIQYIKI